MLIRDLALVAASNVKAKPAAIPFSPDYYFAAVTVIPIFWIAFVIELRGMTRERFWQMHARLREQNRSAWRSIKTTFVELSFLLGVLSMIAELTAFGALRVQHSNGFTDWALGLTLFWLPLACLVGAFVGLGENSSSSTREDGSDEGTPKPPKD